MDVVDSWFTRHQASDGLLGLNETWTETQYTDYWSDKTFDQNIFTLKGNSFITNSTERLISYHFHSVEGYSKIGSYTGNGSTDGPFVYTGFRPAWLLIKNIGLSGDWWLMDATRDPYNVAEKVLYPNLPYTEYVSTSVFGRDFLSNGFKVRNNNSGVNGNYTYIYMAFAEQPFNYANAR